MLKGQCHCGEVNWTLDRSPESATACNCTICRRYGALWAYGLVGRHIQTTGQTIAYRRREYGDIDFHFCATCGCVTHYTSTEAGANGHKRGAVNMRMSDIEVIGDLRIRHFEGCDSFTELPPDGRTVRDMWF